MGKIKRIADTVHGNIEISQIEKDIISQHAFNRLHDIMQNSTAFLTYPSNQTKRFEHSLGVMHLGGEIFYNSIANADDSIRFSFLEKFNSISERSLPLLSEAKVGDEFRFGVAKNCLFFVV